MADKNNENKKKLQYSEESLQNALAAIKTGMKITQASELYKIPRQTLRDKCSGRSVNTKRHPGMESMLGPEIENRLVNWLQQCARQGFGVDKNRLLDSVQTIVTSNNLKTNFANNRPHNTWFYKFMNRHPVLSQKRAEYINKARGSVTEAAIRRWFTGVADILEADTYILNDPKRVWNMDESGFQLSPKSPMVIGEKSRTLYNESSRSNKESITTLFSVNALGTFAPPLTIFKYARIPQNIVDRTPPFWGLGKSDSGWMTASTFYEYIGNVFLPFLTRENITLPVIVFLDGHASHLSLELSEFCANNKIILIALYPNATHILQPLDVAVFGPMKAKWKQLCRQWRIDHDGTEINKQNIPEVLNSFIGDSQMKTNIINGFRCTGLFPFDANSVNYTKIVVRSADCGNETVIPTTEQELFIQKVETNINADVLFSFKQSGDSWNGDMAYKMLFLFWKKISKPTVSIRGSAEEMTSVPSLVRDVSNTDFNNDNVWTEYGESRSRYVYNNSTEMTSEPSLVRNNANTCYNDPTEMTSEPSLVRVNLNTDGNACMASDKSHSRYTGHSFSPLVNVQRSSENAVPIVCNHDPTETTSEPSLVRVNLNTDDNACMALDKSHSRYTDHSFSPLVNVQRSSETTVPIVCYNDPTEMTSEPSLVRVNLNTDGNACMASDKSHSRYTGHSFSPLVNVQRSSETAVPIVCYNDPIEMRSEPSLVRDIANTVNTDGNAWMFSDESRSLYTSNLFSPLVNVQQSFDENGETVRDIVSTLDDDDNACMLSDDSHDRYTSNSTSLPLNVPTVYNNNEQNSTSHHQGSTSTVHRQDFDKILPGRSLISIENLIQWPKSGKCDSKRKRESLPSVLTSHQWQTIQKHKLSEKMKEEEVKAVKKQKREDSKLQKEADKVTKQEKKKKLKQKAAEKPKKGKAKRCR